MTVVLISCAAFAATMVGGLFAIRFRDRLHLILGFSAGAVVGVALFDLLPEAMSLGAKFHAPKETALFVAGGFLVYLLIDRLILLHPQGAHDPQGAHAHARGAFGASALSAHSFLDGIAIGVGYQASPAVGLVVTAAVLTHDFSDGINTVAFILKSGEGWRRALPWLLLDAAAPVLGATATLFFQISHAAIGLVLAVFAGAFLYLGASDLIPESQHAHPRAATTAMTLLGACAICLAVRFAQ